MGKTGSGVRVWLDPDQFTPYDYYQYWINTEDAMVEQYLRQFTFLLDDFIDELTSVTGEALREAKRVLAFEATAMAHGVEAAEQAETAAKTLFARGSGPSADDTSLPTTEIDGFEKDGEPLKLADAFIEAGLTKSRGEARRLAQSNGLAIDDEKVKDVDITLREAIGDRPAVLLRSGKKNFRRVVIKR
jgi:tyrosyl-tRNA synthetase